VPTPESLGLPDVMTRFAESPDGLVLIAGPSGSGKTSTVAAMVHHINRAQRRHVVTLEDPIEFLHRDLSSSITQREIGTDTDDLAQGLLAAMRQDPDVIVTGDLRDPVAVDRALRAAESGTLVLATINAPDATMALVQLVASMSGDEREVGRIRLASALRAVVAQRLVQHPSGEGRQVVVEWVDAVTSLRDAISSGADASAYRKAIERAAKDGRGDTFASAMADAGIADV